MSKVGTLFTKVAFEINVDNYEFSNECLSTSIVTHCSFCHASRSSYINSFFHIEDSNILKELDNNSKAFKFVELVIFEISKSGSVWTGELSFLYDHLDKRKIYIKYNFAKSYDTYFNTFSVKSVPAKKTYKSLLKNLIKQEKEIKNLFVIDERV